MNPLAELATIVRLARLYRAVRPDVVHHFTIKCVLYGSIAARLAQVSRIVNALTGLGYAFMGSDRRARWLKPLVSQFYWIVLRNTQVIFQNPDDLSSFLSAGLVNQEQAHLIRGSGVDVNRFVPGTREAVRPLRVLMAARLLWAKGLGEFVEAASIVGRSVSGEFLVAGDADLGNPDAVPQVTIDGWKRQSSVRFLGHVDDMLDLLSSVDVAVLPSYREGTPRFLLEAAACGLPLVATNVPGCREVVRDNENGFLVPVNDAEALADAILRLLRDENLRRRMGASSREIVCREFSAEHVIARTIAVYAKINT